MQVDLDVVVEFECREEGVDDEELDTLTARELSWVDDMATLAQKQKPITAQAPVYEQHVQRNQSEVTENSQSTEDGGGRRELGEVHPEDTVANELQTRWAQLVSIDLVAEAEELQSEEVETRAAIGAIEAMQGCLMALSADLDAGNKESKQNTINDCN